MTKNPKPTESPLRVSMRFGARTDITLVQHLRGLAPRDRAKFLRDLIKEGWRLRRAPPTP